MKTIEQAVKEYANLRVPVYVADTEITHTVEDLNMVAQVDFQAGVEFAQRWIPVEEECPPIDIDVVLKYRYFDRPLYWVGTINTIERLKHFLNKHLLFTHWRPIDHP